MNRRTTVTLTIETEGEGNDETEIERVFEIDQIGQADESWVLVDDDENPRLILAEGEFHEILREIGEGMGMGADL